MLDFLYQVYPKRSSTRETLRVAYSPWYVFVQLRFVQYHQISIFQTKCKHRVKIFVLMLSSNKIMLDNSIYVPDNTDIFLF